MAKPTSTPRAELSRRERQATLRSNLRQYFGGSSVLGPLSAYVPKFEPDQTTFETKLKMRRDPMIALGLWITKAPICVSDFSVECADPVIREFIKTTITPIWSRLMRTAMKMLDFGWQVHELIYEVEDVEVRFKDVGDSTSPDNPPPLKTVVIEKAIKLKRVKDVNPNTIMPYYDGKRDEFIGVSLLGYPTTDGGSELKVIEKDKLFISTHDEEWGDVRGKSLLDNAYRAWYFGYLVEQLWARYMERRTIPPLIGTAPPGKRTTPEGSEVLIEDIMLTILGNLHNGNGAYMPFEPDPTTRKNQWSIEALQFFAQTDQFQTFMATMDAKMLRGLLIPEKVLIQGTKVGTLSETEQFTDTYLTGLDGYLFALEEAINDQIVDRYLRLNFVSPPRCRLKISQITSQRRAALRDVATLLSEAVNVNARGASYKFPDLIDLPAIARQLGLPTLDPDDILERKEEEPADVNANGGRKNGGGNPPKS